MFCKLLLPSGQVRQICAFWLGTIMTSSCAAAPCDSIEHHAFDFWLGRWEVRTPDGTLAGVNEITQEYGGCVLHERYVGSHTYRGESLNIYDAGRKVWHQTWVDNSGTLLVLEGGIRDGKMVLEGHTSDPTSKLTKQRITWTPNADGSVRQFWEANDEKGQWKTVFDGLYTKAHSKVAEVR
jgi:hypothetical protein